MNILFICDEYPPGKNGGIGTATRTLARELVSQGHTVHVAGLYTPGYGSSDRENDMGVEIWRLRYRIDKGLIKNDYSKTDTLLLKSLSLTGILQRQTASAVRKFYQFISLHVAAHKIDIIEWPDWNHYFKTLPQHIHRPVFTVPVVVKFHCTQSYIASQMNETIEKDIFSLEKQHINNATALVAVSKSTAADMTALYDIKKNVAVLYNSIEVEEKTIQRTWDSKTVIYTGAISKRKGVYSLMKAWNMISAKEPNAQLKLFGKGNKESFMSELNQEAKSSVHFLGHVSKDQLMQEFNEAALAIFPSYTECFALGPMEAMSSGCPVVYTKRASGPELIEDGKNGLLIEPDDVKSIADAVLTILQNKDLQKQFSSEGRATIQNHFTIEQSARDHVQFYQKVIAGFSQLNPT